MSKSIKYVSALFFIFLFSGISLAVTYGGYEWQKCLEGSDGIDWVCVNMTSPIFDKTVAKLGEKVSLTVEGVFAGKKSWLAGIPVLTSSPVGGFVKLIIFKWDGSSWEEIKKLRCNEEKCVEDKFMSEDIYMDYGFDGSLRYFKIVLNNIFDYITQSVGEYKVCAEFWVDVHFGLFDWQDKQVLKSLCSQFKVVKSDEEKEKEKKKKIENPDQPANVTPPDEAYVKQICTLENVTIKPSTTPVHMKPFSLILKFHIKCKKTQPYGPNLRIQIGTGEYTYKYRIGDQGITSDFNKNYYFDNSKTPLDKDYTIEIANIQLPAGTHPVYIQLHYSVSITSGWKDYEVIKWWKAGDIVVKAPEEFEEEKYEKEQNKTKEELKKEWEKLPTCPGKPELEWASWIDKNGQFRVSAKVGEELYAYVVFRNPNSNCVYRGTVKIEFRRRRDFLGIDQLVPDEKLREVRKNVVIPPDEKEVLKIPFSPPKEGLFHYDVYWNGQKYTDGEVIRRYGSAWGGAAGERLEVSGKIEVTKEDVKKSPSKYLLVQDYWFEYKGKKVTKVLEGTRVKGCVKIVPTARFEGTITLEAVKIDAPFEVFDMLDRDTVVAKIDRAYVFEPEQNVTICVEFTAEQKDKTHNTFYYLRLKYEGKEVGIYPPDKKGLKVIPKHGKWNPFIQGADEMGELTIVESHWYYRGEVVDGKVGLPLGTYYVVAVIENPTEITKEATVKIKIRKENFGWFDEDWGRPCVRKIVLDPNQTVTVKCAFTFSDPQKDTGFYHYEIYIDKNKAEPRGPTIGVGKGTTFLYMLNRLIFGLLLNPTTVIGGIIILVLLIGGAIVFAWLTPVIMPALIMLMRFFMMFIEMFRYMFKMLKPPKE